MTDWKKVPRIKDVFPVTNSIFTKMNQDFGMDNGQLDLLFYSDFGLKTVSPIVQNLLDDDGELSTESLQLLAVMLYNKYKIKWERYKDVAEAEYDPLHNYLDEYHEEGENVEDQDTTDRVVEDYTEGIDADNTNTRTDNLSEGVSGSSSSRDLGGDTESRSGFNSASSVEVGDVARDITNTSSNSSTVTNTGTQTIREVRNEDRVISDTKNGIGTKDSTITHSKDGYHRGNIGNISTQKLLVEEIDLWRWNYIQEILYDARDFLSNAMYNIR